MARIKHVIFRFKPFSKKQKQILAWWLPESGVSEKDGIIADGAIRSGKTVSMALSFIMWSMQKFSGENFGMCGKTIGSFRRNVLMVLKLMLRARGYKFKDRRSDNLLEVYRNGVTNYYYIFGGKDESSQDLIQGITLAGVFFDEVALMPESFVNQATGRCSVEGSKFWFNCNPGSPAHWFKKNWIDAAEKKSLLYLHFTMDDNLSLSESVKERCRSMYTGVFYKRYILGLWAVAEGIIYDMFSEPEHIVSIKDIVNKLTNTRYVSVDYGTQNATVFLLWNRGTDGVWYCIREYYYSGRKKGRQKTDLQYAEDLNTWLEGTTIRAVIVDPSAASFIEQLRQKGFTVIKAKNDVLDGIRTVSTKLNTKSIRFVSTCKYTIEEFYSYVWNEKLILKGEDAPMKENDHCMDALRYFCYTILGRKKANVKDKKKQGLK